MYIIHKYTCVSLYIYDTYLKVCCLAALSKKICTKEYIIGWPLRESEP